MKRIVIAALLVICAAVLLRFYFSANASQAANKPEPVIEVPTHAKAQSATAVADMSLPMPLGLKGDPDQGRIFFMGNCFTCHGVNGDGNGPRAYFITPPPRNFLLETSRQRLNRPVIFEAVRNGRLGTVMPSWGKVLTDQEIANVTEFVFENFIMAPQGNTGKQP